MVALTIELPDEVAHRLEDEAQRMNMSVQQLLAFKAEQPLAVAPSKEQIMRDIVKDNAELYRRLA